MKAITLPAVMLGTSLALAAGPQHFNLTAAYVPATKVGANGAVSITFHSLDPEVHVDESPSPRLKLDPDQKVLVDKQPPAPTHVEPFDPDTARFLDPAIPVVFPVAVATGTPRGTQPVKASVTYFYCSKTQGWCRKGTTDVEVSVKVP